MSLFGIKSQKRRDEETGGQAVSEAPVAPVMSPVAARPSVPAARRQPAGLMTAQQLQRTREALGLAEAKLRGTEEALERLRTSQEWLRRYSEVRLTLDMEKRRLGELTKQLAMMADEQRELERFERFEGIMATFLRMKGLEQAIQRNRQDRLQAESDGHEAQELFATRQKVAQQAAEEREQAETRLRQTLEETFRGMQLTAGAETLSQEIAYLKQEEHRASMQMEAATDSIREHSAARDNLAAVLEQERTRRQGMEMHERMLEHGETVLLLLDRLQEIETQLETLQQRQREAETRQNEENELLRRIFAQYQDICSEINTLNDDIARFRTNIQGQSSVQMQTRAMELKGRRQMLLSAQSLWNRISTGYTLIEEKTQTLNTLRLHINHTEESIRALEAEVAQLSRLCHEKEYTYMLSKSQNVIQLRADLKEGTSCSVCGAVHHPFHSDSMLEQSKLIGEFKTDFELLSAETKSKQANLEALRLELADCKGRQQVEEDTLAHIKARQAEDVGEWQLYAQLDQSFAECSESTNLEARQAMLRQLIENATSASEQAQKELDTFTYHMDSINNLSAQLQQQEQKKGDLTGRLNEVNTGCQVMAGQVERIQQQIDQERQHYSGVYERLDKFITIPEWLSEWQSNREGLKGRIQKLMTDWGDTNQRIRQTEERLAAELHLLECEETRLHTLQTEQDRRHSRMETCLDRADEAHNECQRIMGEQDARTYYSLQLKQTLEARALEEKEREAALQIQHETDRIKGRDDNYAQTEEELNAQYLQERNVLDHWIRTFNLHNPPVQYAELESVFSQERDWNELRQRLTQLKLQAAQSQAKTDDLNSRLIALQAEGGRGKVDEDELQISIVGQRDSLEAKRDETAMQIARLRVALEEHEKAEHFMSNSSETHSI